MCQGWIQSSIYGITVSSQSKFNVFINGFTAIEINADQIFGRTGYWLRGTTKRVFSSAQRLNQKWFLGEQECVLPAVQLPFRYLLNLLWLPIILIIIILDFYRTGDLYTLVGWYRYYLAMNGCPFDCFAPSVYSVFGSRVIVGENINVDQRTSCW